MLVLLLCLTSSAHLLRTDPTCAPSSQRKDCGDMSTHQHECENLGCCWRPVDPNPGNLPWCFHKSAVPTPAPSPTPPPSPTPTPGPTPPPAPTPKPTGRAATFVHLFEWSWEDVGTECEKFLGPMGYSAVQVSPPMEHIQGPDWWTRYQPVSYKLVSRSGDRDGFAKMVKRCQAVGVEIYADAVINHMASGSGTGTAGSQYGNRAEPGLYSQNDFHHNGGDSSRNCDVTNYNDQHNVQFCDLVGLPDLCTECAYVQKTIGGYLKDLLSLGVAGFRIDASKHQLASDLGKVLDQGFPRNSHFTFHEVIAGAGEPVKPEMYFDIGHVTEFDFARQLAPKFLQGQLGDLGNFGSKSGLIDTDKAVTFIDNHDTQRGEAKLTYKNGPLYYLATAFMLAHPYGKPKVMSSYAFSDHDQGPPGTPVHQGSDVNCGKGQWVCEHRNPAVAAMVNFRASAGDEGIDNFAVGNNNKALAFGRGSKAFFAVNTDGGNWDATLKTGMKEGKYCGIITSASTSASFALKSNSTAHQPWLQSSGNMTAGEDCPTTINVESDGSVHLSVPSMGIAAFHVGA